MQAETQAHIETIKTAIDLLRKHVDFDAASARLVDLEELSADGDFWNDQAAAQEAMREKNRLQRQVTMITDLQTELDDAAGLIELGEMEGDADVVAEAEEVIASLVTIAEKRQLESLLSGEADGNDCFLEVHAGAGGTEAQDWASMLVRMYSRWCERRGFKLEMIEESAGEEAGVKSVTMRVEGDNAYGWLKTESGVHRLVRISPYDSSARRHTSFASAWVYPVVDDNIEIEVEDQDLRVDTYRSSGAGGQHVNTTDSAVRITHEPSGIVSSCQTERSQHQNRDNAMKQLRAKLFEMEMLKRSAEKQAMEDSKADIGWGSQIRSYVLDDSRIKDLRTGVEIRNTQSVLDGALDPFIQASLKKGL